MIEVHGDLTKTGKVVASGMDTTGDTIGEITAEYSQLYVPGNVPPAASSIRLLPGMQPMDVSSIRDTREGPLMRRTFRMSALPKASEGGKGSGFEPRTREKPLKSLTVSMEDTPIALHPNIANIRAKYGGVVQKDGTIEFPHAMPKGGTGKLWDKEPEKNNPLWGQRTYKTATVVFSTRWLWAGSKDAPWPKWFAAAGQIDNTPYEKYGVPRQKGRDWLYLGLASHTTGKIHEIEESWLLSPVGGWEQAIYGVDSLRLLKKFS